MYVYCVYCIVCILYKFYSVKILISYLPLFPQTKMKKTNNYWCVELSAINAFVNTFFINNLLMINKCKQIKSYIIQCADG